MSNKNIILKKLDRDSWSKFPIGTKVHGCNGGYYLKTEEGYKWWGSGTPQQNPGAPSL